MRSFAVAAILFAATGCSVAVEDVEPSPEPRPEAIQDATTRAEVAVERAVGADGSARSHVSARFISVTGDIDHEEAGQVIGAAQLPEGQELGRCNTLAAPGAAAGAPLSLSSLGEGSIELLDVGDIVLRAGETVVPLAARAFPDVGELVSGVVYTSRGVDAPLPVAAAYWVETASDDAAAPLPALRVTAPAALMDVQLSQDTLRALGLGPQPLGPQRLGPQTMGSQTMGSQTMGPGEERLIIDVEQDVLVSWSAGEPAAGDYVVVEMSEAEADGKTLQCVFADNGAATIPAQQLGFATGTDIELVVRRLRKTRPTVEGQPGAEGLEDAVVWFDFSVSARAAIQ